MNSTHHTFDFVLGIMQRLAHAQIATWLSGGWAEELWGMCAARLHRDIDLLYPAPHFERLDQWVASINDVSEIAAKHFPHKHAFLYQNIMIEVILLSSDGRGGHCTDFFQQRYRFLWPEHTLQQISVRGQDVPVASQQALRQYRQQHHLIALAYQHSRQEQLPL